MAVEKALKVTINCYKKWYLPVNALNKKHSSKQVIPITGLLLLLHLKVCESFLFRVRTRKCSIPWSVCLFIFLEKRRPHKYSLCKINLVFYMWILSLICQRINLFRKIEIYNLGYVFAYFCGGYKNTFWLQFCSSFK